MLIECEVWKQDPGRLVYVGGSGWNYCWTEREVVDTDQFDWWQGVENPKGGPYPDQWWVRYKNDSHRYPLIVPWKTLGKIRELLGKEVVKI